LGKPVAFGIVGIQHNAEANAIERLDTVRDANDFVSRLSVEVEEDNEYDPTAMAVFFDGYRLGYVAKTDKEDCRRATQYKEFQVVANTEDTDDLAWITVTGVS
jgi:hypothetical protein